MSWELVKRVGVQEYTLQEAAGIVGMSLRGIIIQYGRAIDRLTGMFLAAGMLEAVNGIVRDQAASQPEIVQNLVKGSEAGEIAQTADSEREES